MLNEEDIKKIENPEYDLEGEREKEKNYLYDAYNNLIDILKHYCDLREDYYPLIAAWIMGTYIHNEFVSYPYLFINAMRGSGKTRLLKLITFLSKDGEILSSPTEAVLFRTKGTLGIDEFESIGRKGLENIRELLNACYKKGTKVKRMKQKKTLEGVEQVVEEFSIYRPLVMANIWGMEEVLGDRCIQIILEKSDKDSITNLVEIFEADDLITNTKKILSEECSLCSVVSVLEVYKRWNSYVKNNYNIYTTYTYNINNNNSIQEEIFPKIKELKINGRDLELSFPLFLVGMSINNNTFENLLKIIKKIMDEKREDQFAESQDVSFIDFISQLTTTDWIYVSDLTKQFQEFLQSHDEWINTKWVGRALKRLNLLIEKKRLNRGVLIRANIQKAQEKVRMFK